MDGKIFMMRHPYIELAKYSMDSFGDDDNESSKGEESGKSNK